MRTVLVTIVCGVLSVEAARLFTTALGAQRVNSRGQVVRAQEGERIFGSSLIKVSPQSGAPNLASP